MVATPDEASTVPLRCRVNASVSGVAMNSEIVELTSSRSWAGAPLAARTAASASAPRLTIWEAIAMQPAAALGQRHAGRRPS